MQENINIPDSTITTNLSFRNLVLMNMQQLTNFPYIEKDFDALTDYELLCLVVKFLNDVIANQNEQNNSITRMYESFLALQDYVNNTKDKLEDAFNNLDNYVRNYFDNLDVQNEIDNKLDEMVEQGTLQEIISDYLNSNAVFGFDTVTDLKSSTNLINGSYARTLGYHNVNDDGGALYKIRTITSDDVVDEMFILEMENDDSLIAELIIENAININTLGADNTGQTDSSSIFNKAFQFINNLWLSGNYKINTIVCEGKYLWNNQVKMPPCSRLRTSGYTTILTNISGSALLIDYLSTTQPSNFPGNKQDWLYAELINFSNGGIFKNVGENLTGTCIEIGRDSNIGVQLPYSRYKLCNFRIYNYNIGILHNAYHNYIGKFDNISFESNNIGVQYGALSGSATDSGENMTYNNCLFASGINGIKWLVPSFDSSFVNCSFDFLQNCFNDSENKGYKRISIINSHLEGFNYICSSLGTHSQMIIQQSSIMYTQRGNMFDNISDNSIITLNNNKILPFKTDIYDPELLTDNSNRISLLNNFVGHGALSFLFTKNNLINNFDNLQDGDITLAVNNSIGIFTVKALTGNVLTAKIVTDNYLYTGHKSLVLVSTTDEATTKTINLESNYIPINSIRTILYSNIITYNCRGGQNIFFRFYDENKELIFETSGYQFMPENSNKEPSKWYMDPYGKKVNVPSNAQYMKVQYNINNMNNSTADEIGTEYKIGGLIIN